MGGGASRGKRSDEANTVPPEDLKAFADKQRLWVDVRHNLEWVREELLRGVANRGSRGSNIEMIISTAGSRAGASGILAKCILDFEAEHPADMAELIVAIESALSTAWVGSALSGFEGEWRRGGVSSDETADDLARAAASKDIAAVGRQLGARDVDMIKFDGDRLPSSLVRRPWACSLLEVAVGSSSVEMTKYLLEFHGAKPTREALKMAISSGSLELIRMMRERLPEGELGERVDLMEVAADFHQEEAGVVVSGRAGGGFRERASTVVASYA
jgi:hypothetical protein